MVTIGRLPFPAALLVVAALAVLSLYGGFAAGLGGSAVVFLVIPLGVGVWYLMEYRGRTLEVEAVSEEGFDDPVEEADRIDHEGVRESGVPPPSPPTPTLPIPPPASNGAPEDDEVE